MLGLAKGNYEVEVEGVKYGFRFGPAAGHFLEQVAGFSMSEYFVKFTNGKSSTCLLFFFYGGHKFHLLTKLEQVKKMAVTGSETAIKERDRLQYEFDNCSIVTISDIVEKVGLAECLRIHNEALGIPNLKAPNLTGQPTQEITGSEITTKSELPASD